MSATEPRPICWTCRRPEVVCYCRFVTKHTTRTRVVILQHPREHEVPINTARIASLCLPDAELHVGVRWDSLAGLVDPDRPAALLYPGPGAIDVETSPPAGPITLVVVDGTWWQARKLVRANPALGALPLIAFRPPKPSDYRIRKEPHEDYVSTVEALVHVLGALEPDGERFTSMLAPFRAMVDAQVAYAAKSTGGRHLTKRPRAPVDPRSRLPLLLRERHQDLVCVYAEANAWPYRATERGASPDELVQWVACRPATGETFDAIVAPRRALSPKTPSHVGLDGATLLAGITTEELSARWAKFVRPTDVIGAWGGYSPRLFVEAGGALPKSQVDLRQAARTYAARAVGSMEDFRASIRAEIEPPSIPITRLAVGRAGQRLADLVAIASLLTLPPREAIAASAVSASSASSHDEDRE